MHELFSSHAELYEVHLGIKYRSGFFFSWTFVFMLPLRLKWQIKLWFGAKWATVKNYQHNIPVKLNYLPVWNHLLTEYEVFVGVEYAHITLAFLSTFSSQWRIMKIILVFLISLHRLSAHEWISFLFFFLWSLFSILIYLKCSQCRFLKNLWKCADHKTGCWRSQWQSVSVDFYSFHTKLYYSNHDFILFLIKEEEEIFLVF